MTQGQLAQISEIIFSRYPDLEWGTLFQFGYRVDPSAGLLMTVSGVLAPVKGDLNSDVGNVQFLEPYILRAALGMAADGLAVGVIHSHPEDYGVRPSTVDDAMDSYFGHHFGSFGPNRPYLSLIFSKTKRGDLRFSGRVLWQGEWHVVDLCTVVGDVLTRLPGPDYRDRPVPANIKKRMARFSSALGEEVARNLWNSTVAVVGCGGTGSPAALVLARSSVGRIILVDFDPIDWSNSERVHGCHEAHLTAEVRRLKVELIRDEIHRINPVIEVIAIVGNCLQEEVWARLLHADLVLGCTDTEHGRAALSELAYRYLVPVFQVNVSLESSGPRLSGQIIQITRFRPGKACAYCRAQVNSRLLSIELMPESERSLRKREAAAAIARGESGDPYWREPPVIPTVGALTTVAGGLVADYALGMLSGRYGPPAEQMELNLLSLSLGYVSLDLDAEETCPCRTSVGWSEQTLEGRLHLPPSHLPPPRRV